MAALDAFQAQPKSIQSPATDAAAVTTSDTVDLAQVTKALFVGGAGNVTVITADGSTVLFTGVLAGTVLSIRVSRVKATGTTATNIVALF